MGKLLLWIGWALALAHCDGVSHKLVCYFTNWAHRRPGMASISPKDVDPLLCTHLIFAFASMENNQLVAKTALDEAVFYPEINRLKERNQRLKTLLSVGGWDFGTERFTTLLSTATRRAKFIQSAISLLRTYNFDGLDLFFLYPGQRGSPLHDRWNFLFLIEELLFAFRREAAISCHPRLLLSAAVSGAPHIIHTSYDVRFLGRYLDFINILSYDFHGSWEGVTGHNSPLHSLSGDPKSSAFAINYWRTLGAPSEKLIMGLPAYGRTFCLLKDSEAWLGAKTTGPGLPGKYTKQAGFLAYFEVCSFVRQAEKSWIDNQFVPYAYKGKTWVGYDDAASFTYKAMFIKRELFGGAMVWTLDLDDAKGSFCGNGPFPLVRILSNLLLNDGDERVATESHRHYENTMPGETVTPGRETMALGEHKVTLKKKSMASEEMATSPTVAPEEMLTSPVDSSTVAPEEMLTSPVDSSTVAPEEMLTSPVDSSTVAPEEMLTSPVDSSTVAPEEMLTSPVDSSTVAPEEMLTSPVDSSTVAPEEMLTSPVDSSTVAPEEMLTSPVDSSTVTPEEMLTSPVDSSTVMSEETDTSSVGSSTVMSEETDTSPVDSSTVTPEEMAMPPVGYATAASEELTMAPVHHPLIVTPEGTTTIPVNVQAETPTGRMTLAPARKPVTPEKIVTPLGKILVSSAEQTKALRGKNLTSRVNFDCPMGNLSL